VSSHQTAERIGAACRPALDQAFASSDPTGNVIEVRERWARGLLLGEPDALADGEKLLREALAQASAAGLHPSDPRVLLARQTLTLNLLAQDRLQDALAEARALASAIKNELKTDSPNTTFKIRMAVALVDLAVGDIADALSSVDEATVNTDRSPDTRVSFHFIRGAVLLTLGQPLDALKEATGIAGAADELSGNEQRYDRALANRLRGAALIELGRYPEALPLLEVDSETMRSMHPNSREAGAALTLYGDVLIRLGRDDDAAPVLESAAVAYRGQTPAAQALALQAQIAARRGYCAPASHQFDVVLNGARQTTAPQDLAALIAQRGWMAHLCRDPVTAERYLNSAARRLEHITSTQSNFAPDILALWRQRYRSVFEEDLLVIVEALVTDSEQNDERLKGAFEVIQLSRSSGTDLAIARSVRRNVAHDPQTRELAQQLDQLTEADRRGRIEDRVGDLSLPLRSGWNLPGLEQVRKRLQQNPELLSETTLSPVPLAEAQAALHPGEGLLVLSVGARRGHVFAVTHDSAQVFPVQSTADDLQQSVAQLLRAVTPPGV
jgi:tetratricopeptide (TPR) repeat protein